jgi:nicotinamide mononucleotide (NMN) deamidase PncC
VAVATTGVAGPGEQEGIAPGTVFFATVVDGVAETGMVKLPFDRERTRQFSVITVLDRLRRRLLAG